MTNYQKGYRFELKCRDYLRWKGWSCDRTPASKSPYDLTAVRKCPDGSLMVWRVQCQKHLPFTKKKVRTLMDWCEKEGTQPILAWDNHNTHIKHAVDYLMEDLYKVKIEGGDIKDERL